MITKQYKLTIDNVREMLHSFVGLQEQETELPFETDTHYYSTSHKTALAVSKTVAGESSTIKTNKSVSLTKRAVSIFDFRNDNHITISMPFVYSTIIDNIKEGSKKYHNAVTKISIDNLNDYSVKIDTNSLVCFQDTFHLKEHEESYSIRLGKELNLCTVHTVLPNVQQHVTFKSEELAEILNVFQNEKSFTISIKDVHSKVLFSSLDSSIQVVALPYSLF